MAKKKEQTGKAKAEALASSEYGPPIYATINASYNKDLVLAETEKLIHEAYEYNSVLYITVNSGVPKPPPCLPGQPCHE